MKKIKYILMSLLSVSLLFACQNNIPSSSSSFVSNNDSSVTSTSISSSSSFDDKMLQDKDFLTAKDTNYVNQDGEIVSLQGINIGGWLHLEGWMDGGGNDNNDYAVRTALKNRFSNAEYEEIMSYYQSIYFTEDDLDYIASLGLNLIRIPVYYMELMDDEGNIKENAFENLDWAINEGKKRGIYTLIDLHGAPGGQSNGWLTGGQTGSNELWTNTEYQKLTIKIWKAIAEHYNGEEAVMGYGLLNEPVPSEDTLLSRGEMYDLLYDAVRAIDKDHIIVIGAFYSYDDIGNPFDYNWTNVVYETHHYNDSDHSYNGQVGFANGQITYLKQYQEAYNIPLLAGEYNFFPISDAWLTFMNTLNSLNIAWTSWTYKNTDTDFSNNWGLFLAPDAVAVNWQEDSLETIKEKLSHYQTSYYQENTFLKDLIKQSTGPINPLENQRISPSLYDIAASKEEYLSPVNNLSDLDYQTRFSNGAAQTSDGSSYLEITFQKYHDVGQIFLFSPDCDYGRKLRIECKISENDNYRLLGEYDGQIGSQFISFTKMNIKKLKISLIGRASNNYWSIYELALYE